MTEVPARLVVGRVLRPHGLHGEVAVEVLSDAPGRFAPGAELGLGDLDAGGAAATGTGLRPLVVAAARWHHGRLLLTVDGVGDRDAAETLRGGLLSIPVEAARPLEPGEYWPHQLIGLPVLDRDGQPRGTIAEVLPGTAHDLLSVRLPDDRTALVPAVAALVRVDLDAGRVVVDTLPGLLDPS